MKLFQSHFDGRMHVLETRQHLWGTFDTSFSWSRSDMITLMLAGTPNLSG